jgi:uncharacterized protein with HEPN domain
MQHEIQAIRHDILTAIAEIQEFVSGRRLADLPGDRALQLVLEREFEIIGEALCRLRNVAPACFEKIPGGHRIIGMRNILAHAYDRVDHEILWDAATLELDGLRAHLKSLLPDP